MNVLIVNISLHFARFNNRLKSLARALHLTSPVTSYTIRHSWATTAKYPWSSN